MRLRNQINLNFLSNIFTEKTDFDTGDDQEASYASALQFAPIRKK